MSDNNSSFVDLNKLTRIISDETKRHSKPSTLIPESVSLNRSKSADLSSLRIDSIFSPSTRFNYNRDHINGIAKHLNLISDTYKDVKVDLPLQESLMMLQHDDIEIDAQSAPLCTCNYGTACKLHPHGQKHKKHDN